MREFVPERSLCLSGPGHLCHLSSMRSADELVTWIEVNLTSSAPPLQRIIWKAEVLVLLSARASRLVALALHRAHRVVAHRVSLSRVALQPWISR
jgi:hypothetical protein